MFCRRVLELLAVFHLAVCGWVTCVRASNGSVRVRFEGQRADAPCALGRLAASAEALPIPEDTKGPHWRRFCCRVLHLSCPVVIALAGRCAGLRPLGSRTAPSC